MATPLGMQDWTWIPCSESMESYSHRTARDDSLLSVRVREKEEISTKGSNERGRKGAGLVKPLKFIEMFLAVLSIFINNCQSKIDISSNRSSVSRSVLSDSSNPMDCSPLGSTIHGILLARILEWVAIPFSKRSSWPRNQTQVFCIADRFFIIWATREAQWICLYQMGIHEMHSKIK